MKKNRMMRLASILLVCVLLTTSVISGTFAKYTTTASGSDTARVAKWGFATTTLAIDMFDGEYSNVDSNDDTNVVAPGTTKTATITLIPSTQTTPEVDYHFDVNVSAPAASNDAALLAKLTWSFNGNEVGNFADLQAAINTAYDKDYNAGELPAKTFTVAWEWPFDTDNVSDTAMANAGEAKLDIVFDFTATQID